MNQLKIWPDKIFDGYRFLEGYVLVTSQDGIVEAIVPLTEAGDDIEQFAGLLVPGFVNCHCHLELSHMKGKVPEKTGLVDFVFKVVTDRAASEEDILQAIVDGENEMKTAGIVAVGDICNNTLTLSQKQKGNLHYYNFIEASGWLPEVSETRFARAKDLFNQFSILQSPFSNCSIVPHAPYSVSDDLWKRIQPYFQNRTVSIHNQETKFEDEFFLEGTGDFTRMYKLMKIDNRHHKPTNLSSLQSYIDNLNDAKTVILVHNTFIKQSDIDWVQSPIRRHQPKTFFCLCVNANQYIENALPPIELLRKNNCSIVLGTDSLASNWSLNILDEIKTIRKNFPQIPLEEILGWATINGARALGMDNILGSFERGKKPGIILLDEQDVQIKNVLM